MHLFWRGIIEARTSLKSILLSSAVCRMDRDEANIYFWLNDDVENRWVQLGFITVEWPRPRPVEEIKWIKVKTTTSWRYHTLEICLNKTTDWYVLDLLCCTFFLSTFFEELCHKLLLNKPHNLWINCPFFIFSRLAWQIFSFLGKNTRNVLYLFFTFFPLIL